MWGLRSLELPDVAIEVVWTSGGIDKLEIYRRLGVSEVWFWKDGRIDVHVLQQGRYEPATSSNVFPDLDFVQLCACLDRPTAMQAVRAFRDTLRAG
jgi:Uma2 family endonuclease